MPASAAMSSVGWSALGAHTPKAPRGGGLACPPRDGRARADAAVPCSGMHTGSRECGRCGAPLPSTLGGIGGTRLMALPRPGTRTVARCDDSAVCSLDSGAPAPAGVGGTTLPAALPPRVAYRGLAESAGTDPCGTSGPARACCSCCAPTAGALCTGFALLSPCCWR